MALGAITPQAVDPHSSTQAVPLNLGDVRYTVTNVVGDGAYATGGSVLTPAQLGLTTVLSADVQIIASTGTNSNAATGAYNVSTGKLQCFAGAGTTPNIGLAEPNSVNLSGITFQVTALGV